MIWTTESRAVVFFFFLLVTLPFALMVWLYPPRQIERVTSEDLELLAQIGTGIRQCQLIDEAKQRDECTVHVIMGDR